ncbi:MAG: hypothetical protein A4E52_01416 [Pelotomaculum sp. PtaB.Bin013]|nr:MAG: hypothetical protein A4E52_01416 [Pelotomaculum sp. PtaB.Bin013]
MGNRLRQGAQHHVGDPLGGVDVRVGDRRRETGVDQGAGRGDNLHYPGYAFAGRQLGIGHGFDGKKDTGQGNAPGGIDGAFYLRAGAGKVNLDAPAIDLHAGGDFDQVAADAVPFQVISELITAVGNTA